MNPDALPLDMLDDGGMPLYSWLDFHDDARDLIAALRAARVTIDAIVAIPRGGVVLGVLLSHAFTVPLYVRDRPEGWDTPATLVVDDNAITGNSLQPFLYRGMTCAVLVKHPNVGPLSSIYFARESDEVFLFPWEAEAAQTPYALCDVVTHDCDGYDADPEDR